MSNGFLALDVVAVTPYFLVDDHMPFFKLAEWLKLEDIYMTQDQYDDLTHKEWIEGDYESFETELDCVENWASDNGLISGNQDACDRFRQIWQENDSLKLQWYEMSDNEKDSHFADWVDGQSRDYQLHEQQRLNYEYEE